MQSSHRRKRRGRLFRGADVGLSCDGYCFGVLDAPDTLMWFFTV
jgi:hypothetical protein